MIYKKQFRVTIQPLLASPPKSPSPFGRGTRSILFVCAFGAKNNISKWVSVANPKALSIGEGAAIAAGEAKKRIGLNPTLRSRSPHTSQPIPHTTLGAFADNAE